MKLLIVTASLDLTQPFSATPAWWQLLKALYEVGIDVIATPYQGPAIESLWWRAEANPAKRYGDTFKAARDLIRKLSGDKPQVQLNENTTTTNDESATDRIIRQVAQKLIAPLWQQHLDRILTQQSDIDAVIFLTIPLNHVVGVAEYLISKHNKPVLYYDGDVPASLPNMHGFASGFRIYQGANPAEYTAFISNSLGGEKYLKELGAKATHTIFYGVDTDVFSAVPVPQQDIDIMFYGHGREYRGQWIDDMIASPARAMPDTRFAVRGTRLGDLGPTQLLPYLSFSKLREYACRSKVNLCITRRAHASVYGSSSSRPFELSSMGACIVANPYEGLDLWFEPEKEIIVVHSQAEAIDRYRYLLKNEAERQRMGQAAQQRVLAEHTMRHRARQLVDIVNGYC